MADKIQVAVRVLPLILKKKDVVVHWSWSENAICQCEPGTQKKIGDPYSFDQVFGTETQNYQIFTKLVQPLIDSAMNGFNVTVLAYGQTATGKTYTMMGSQKELGIVQLAVNRIFTFIGEHAERAFLLKCSYIEIYNEKVYDLLASDPQSLRVGDLVEGHVVIHELLEIKVNTPDAVLKLMQQGNKQRKVGGTAMNGKSSRSHTIFRIIVESLPGDEAAAVKVSHINLVDLAGSEKASQTNASGVRAQEGSHINKSLSEFSYTINQLSVGKEPINNYRGCQLSRILQESLGGNARTAIICNVASTVLDETSSTLKFACSAKAIQNKPQVNKVLSDQALIHKYKYQMKDLEKKLKEKQLEKSPEAIEEMRRQLQEKDLKINEIKAEHEREIHAMQTDHKLQIETKLTEKKRLAKELADLKDKFERLEKDHSKLDERHAKREADLQESADKLHQALQTANDREVLSLDTQRKLSELKTEFQTKEAEHKREIHAMQTDHKLQIETKLTEKKRLAQELADLKDKFERLEKDHSELDERHAKREVDLREKVAWGQLELLGLDPNTIKENFNAKQKLTQVEQELLEMQKFNSDAQSRIASLTEELRTFKTSAVPVPEASVKSDDDRHNSSLTGMCMEDELRDVFMNRDCSFAPRSINQTRKRLRSFFSDELVKLDQSASMLDSTEHEMEPSKKTRLSIQSDVSEEMDESQWYKEMREYLVELLAWLNRNQADSEIPGQGKEQPNSQLLNAQTEIESIRELKNKVEPVGRLQDEENFAKKSDTSEEMLDASCFVGEPSISTSVIDMEQLCESDDFLRSLRDQFTD